jgi:arylsulfatase A-like enzyme
MTGLRPSTSGIYDNPHKFRNHPPTADAVTLPQHFAANGYHTFGVGKLFHGSSGQENFQTYGPALGQGPLPEERINATDEASKTRLWDWGAYPESIEEAHDYISAQWTAQLLAEDQNEPFFLGVGFYRPHVPCYAPPEWFESRPLEEVRLPPYLDTDLDDVPEFGRNLIENGSVAPSHAWLVENDQWRRVVQSYLACTEFMDHCLGIVLDALDGGPNAGNTWIILTGDHGWHLGEKDHLAKRTLWERSTRVPLIVIPPPDSKGWAHNATCTQPVEMLSIYPTLIELCSIPARDELEGHSIVPLLKDTDAEWPHPAITTHLPENHTVCTQNWRYIKYADGSEELYNHQDDPNEWHNLANNPDLEEVISEHRAHLPKLNAPPPASSPKTRKKRQHGKPQLAPSLTPPSAPPLRR